MTLDERYMKIKDLYKSVYSDTRNHDSDRKELICMLLQLVMPIATYSQTYLEYDSEKEQVMFKNQHGDVYDSISVKADSPVGFLKDIIAGL